MTRRILPTRRPCVTTDIKWNRLKMTIAVGFDPETGDVLEVFADATDGGVRHGQFGDVIRDAAIGASVALQFGTPMATLAKSLGTVPVWHLGKEREAPASPMGAIMGAIMAVVLEVGQ